MAMAVQCRTTLGGNTGSIAKIHVMTHAHVQTSLVQTAASSGCKFLSLMPCYIPLLLGYSICFIHVMSFHYIARHAHEHARVFVALQMACPQQLDRHIATVSD